MGFFPTSLTFKKNVEADVFFEKFQKKEVNHSLLTCSLKVGKEMTFKIINSQ